MSSSSPSDCVTVEQLLFFPIYNIITWIHLLIMLAIFTMVIVLIRQYFKSKLAFHGNLTLLICNAIIFYVLNCLFWTVHLLRYKYLQSTYKNSCDLLTPVWLTIILISPPYFYLMANCLIHFAIMLERFRATVFVHQYETVGLRYGIFGAIIVWTISIAFSMAIVLSALADSDTFGGKPLAIVSLTSKYNAQAIIYAIYFTLAISIINTVGDFYVVQMNKKIQKSNKLQHRMEDYSLRKIYQLNENLSSMQLILPLDFSYALLFGLYMIGGIVLRYNQHQLSIIQYTGYYYTIMTLPLLHSAITLLIYIWFIRTMAQKRKAIKTQPPLDESGQLYFRQLRQQWGTAGQQRSTATPS